jgi:nitrogen permease regulator 3
MARELIDLNLAKPIPALSLRATYIVSPLAPLHALSSHSRAFAEVVPSPTLPVLVSSISAGQPRRWDSLVQEHSLPLTVLPWLMRNGWLTQLRQFYFIRIPGAISHLKEDLILADPYRASQEEVRWMQLLAEKVGGTKARVFQRLVKYFDGKSAKEKILRREEVQRRELEEVITAFKEVGGIVVAEHW